MSRPTRLVVLPLVAAVVGIAVGAVLMGLVLLLVRAQPSDGDGWGSLGLIVVGMLLAVAAGVVVWVAGLAGAARRLFDAGRRLGVVIVAVGAVFVLVVLVLGAPAALANGVAPAVLLGALMALTIPRVVFRLWDRRAVSP